VVVAVVVAQALEVGVQPEEPGVAVLVAQILETGRLELLTQAAVVVAVVTLLLEMVALEAQAWSSLRFLVPGLQPSQAVLHPRYRLLAASIFTP
jgi:hypothetical protein